MEEDGGGDDDDDDDSTRGFRKIKRIETSATMGCRKRRLLFVLFAEGGSFLRCLLGLSLLSDLIVCFSCFNTQNNHENCLSSTVLATATASRNRK